MEPDRESDSETETLWDAESYVNQPEIEHAWAEKCVAHMDTHFNLLTSIPGSQLKLCPYDDEMYEAFTSHFPNLKLDILDVNLLKSDEGKKEWRAYCDPFMEKVDDANFGCLVRIDCSGEYVEDNTVLVLRIQFLAIEIARNRQGLNDHFCKND